MSEIKEQYHLDKEKNPGAEIENFWGKYSKLITYGFAAVLLIVAGFLGYRYYIQEPNEKKAADAMFHAENYFRGDSARLALNGDNLNAGFLKIMSKYSGTKAANLAGFYAGSCYLKLEDFNNAIKYLKEFSTTEPQLKARTMGLLGDAYSELNKKEDAVESYKKAGTMVEKDDLFSPEYLFRAGFLYESMGKNKEAIEMYQLIKDRYPNTQRGFDIDRYLARLGSVK